MNISPCGMPASPQDWACRLLAATRLASGFGEIYLDPSRGPSALLGMRGMARRKAQNPYGSCLAARGRLAARQSQRFPAPGPAFVRSVALECADRSISQLLAGPPSGSRRELRCRPSALLRKARRRRTSSRFTTPHDRAPQWTRCVHHTAGLGGGDKLGRYSRRKSHLAGVYHRQAPKGFDHKHFCPGRGPGSVP